MLERTHTRILERTHKGQYTHTGTYPYKKGQKRNKRLEVKGLPEKEQKNTYGYVPRSVNMYYHALWLSA